MCRPYVVTLDAKQCNFHQTNIAHQTASGSVHLVVFILQRNCLFYYYILPMQIENETVRWTRPPVYYKLLT